MGRDALAAPHRRGWSQSVSREEPDKLADAIRGVVREQMGGSTQVKRLLVELARVVLAEAERLEAVEPEAPHATGDEPTTDKPRALEPPPVRRAEPERVPLERLRIGGAAVSTGGIAPAPASRNITARAPTSAPEQPTTNEIDLLLIVTRSRLKAESCRFFIERRAHEGDPIRDPEFSSRINAMIARAKELPSCFLWVFWKEAKQPSDAELQQIAECYDALADAAALCHRAVDPAGPFSDDEVETAFALLAEASSALRIAIGWTWLTSPDVDQDESHLWLRRETVTRTIYVRRHMMLDDPADPERASEVRREVARYIENADRRQQHEKKIESLLNKARYHAKKVADAPEPDEHDCVKIGEVIDELAEFGVRASDRRIREIGKSLVGVEFSASAPKHSWLLVHAEPDRAASSDVPHDNAVTAPGWSDRVLEVRELLRGGRMVIIGGEPRQDAIARIENAFALDAIDWITLSEHGSASGMEAPIRREETRLVLVLIKLTGHLYAERARELASDAGKPCVMMPAGYNPEQIAEQVARQAASRLERAAMVVPDDDPADHPFDR